ncbi:MAG: hypothetical protein R3A80_03795 [Bdellovibrionota bacterium]
MISVKFETRLKELVGQTRDVVLDAVQIHLEDSFPKVWKLVRGRILSAFGRSGLDQKISDLIVSERQDEVGCE